ncbi:MAG: GntR family transcriptional regulator [Anaerolineae bacterium]|nr:GntR family transcriptional regulator [Anaerolineae bacterium]
MKNGVRSIKGISVNMLVRSKKDVVLDYLRDNIINGVFHPGDRLIIDELATHLGVSQIPVREALQQLHAEGFVDLQMHASAVVTEVKLSLFDEAFSLMEAAELISARGASKVCTTAQFAEIQAMVAEMDELLDDLDAWTAANIRMHQYICDCAGMRLVKITLTRAMQHWNRLRKMYANEVFAERVHHAQKQHWDMLAAMQAKDDAMIERAVLDHIRISKQVYSQYLEAAFAEQTQAVFAEDVSA